MGSTTYAPGGHPHVDSSSSVLFVAQLLVWSC